MFVFWDPPNTGWEWIFLMSFRHSLELHSEAGERQTLPSPIIPPLSGRQAYTAQEWTLKPTQQRSPFPRAENKASAPEEKGDMHY